MPSGNNESSKNSLDNLTFSKHNQRNQKIGKGMGLVNLGNVKESETRWLEGFSRKVD